MSDTFDLADAMAAMPMIRWMRARKALDLTGEEILEDTFAQLIIAANEKGRSESGKDDYPRYLQMSMRDLTTFLGLSDEDDETKSDDES